MEIAFSLLAIPLMILNFLAGIVGGLALLFKGEWQLFALGIGYGFFGSFIIGTLLLPGMIFAAPLASNTIQRSGLLTGIFGLLSIVYTYIVMTFTTVTVFSAINFQNDAGFFHLLWGYSTATAPWGYMANQERRAGNPDAAFPLFFLQLGSISMMVAKGVFEVNATDLLFWFLPFMILGVLTQFVIGTIMAKEERNFRSGFRSPIPARRISDFD